MSCEYFIVAGGEGGGRLRYNNEYRFTTFPPSHHFSKLLFLQIVRLFYSYKLSRYYSCSNECFFFGSIQFLLHIEMARDSAVGRERVLVVPGSLALDNSSTNQHVASAQNDLNHQIREVSLNPPSIPL